MSPPCAVSPENVIDAENPSNCGRQAWIVRASEMARKTRNPIRSIVDNLKIEPNPEKMMIALSIGDPTIFGNLQPPREIFDAVKESLESVKFNGYAPSTGFLSAREAVAKYSSYGGVTVEAKDVILCSGCSHSLELCLSVLANPGQNILVPRPGFCIYATQAEGIGIEAKPYYLLPEQKWEVDIKQLEGAIDSSTAAIVINNPGNPCGSVYRKQHLLDILAVANRHRVPIISDEIYEHMVFPGEDFHSLASLSADVPILQCSGLTKRFLVPGWRMGWIIIHDRNEAFSKEVRGGLQALSQRIIGSNTLIQGAIPAILEKTPQTFFDNTMNTIYNHAKIAYEELSSVPGLRPIMPQGAMYMMVGIDMDLFPAFSCDLEIVERLVSEESVFLLAGQCFGISGFVRIVLSVPEDMLREACSRIRAFFWHHAVQDKNEILVQTMVPIKPQTTLETIANEAFWVGNGNTFKWRPLPFRRRKLLQYQFNILDKKKSYLP